MDITQKYDRSEFINFLKNQFLPEDFAQNLKEIEVARTWTYFKNITEIGTCKSLNLTIYEFEINSVSDPRVTITRDSFEVISKYGTQNTLAIYYNLKNKEWRFSFLTYTVEVNDRNRLERRISNPKRFSFLLGENCKKHTPETMLFGKGKVKDNKDLQERFAVDTVSDSFFREYKVFYEDFVQYITGCRYVEKSKGKAEKESIHEPNQSIFPKFLSEANDVEKDAQKLVRDYIKKMMGRLVFLQFMQKKRWLGVEQDDKCWSTGDTNFVYTLFKNSSSAEKNDFLTKVLDPLFFGMLNTPEEDRKEKFANEKWDLTLLDRFKKIPYLNGGLFAKDELDAIKIKFPKEMFCNPDKEDVERVFRGKKNPYDYEASCGLLDFFNRYNFTIDESDPADIEVGVDPEMLGKIFENLLEDNKEKGAFYTPKEIVNYMCKESLIAYLCSKSGSNINETDIRSFVENLTVPEKWGKEEKRIITKYLEDVKICDPAVGSGAFPMGLLNLLFNCRHLLNDEEQLSRAEIKMHIVQNSIYGVDIEKGAVDIARLRFWLSIVVDAVKPEPLPNLDYKIMQGNSLIESYGNTDLSHLLTTVSDCLFDADTDQIISLQKAIQGYYLPHDNKAKEKIQEEIKEKVIAIVKERLPDPKVISDLEQIDLHANQKFFLWHTWFCDVFNRPSKDGSAGGFDIVIGNPPYFRYQENHKGELSVLKQQSYLKCAFGGKLNAYKLFLAEALNQLVADGGMVCYIFQNSFLGDAQASQLRKAVFDKSQIFVIDSFPERDNKKKRVFESVKMSVCVLLFKKEKKDKEFIVNFWEDKYKLQGMTTTFTYNDIKLLDPELLTIPRIEKKNIPLLIKIKNYKNKIQLHCYEGELNMTTHREYFTTDKNNPKVLKGASIQRYYWTEKMSQGEIEFVNEEKYLNDFSRADKITHHNYNRIALQGMTGANDKVRIIATIIENGLYLANSCNYILPDKENNLYYVLGILNSKLINWYFRCFSTNSNVNGYEVDNFPIPKADKDIQTIVTNIVKQIMVIKRKDEIANVGDLEKQIDDITFKLFNLTVDEKEIING